MALTKLPYSRLEPLIREHLSIEEEESVAELIRRLRVARKRGYVTPAELEAVCYWKSPRAIQYIRSNSPAQIRATTRSALATRSERLRLEALRQLKGCFGANGVSPSYVAKSKTLRRDRYSSMATST
jgi:hypothetical protein